MAFSLAQTPTTLNAIDKLIWRGTLTDLGTDPVEIRAAWKLDSSGEVVELSSTRPGTTSDPIVLDFTDNIKGLVKTKLPTIGALGVQNDTGFIKEFTLQYGTITINKDTGAVTESVGSSSGPFKVFNGANNIWDVSLITAPGTYLLTYRPTKYNLLRTSLDYMWLLGSGTVQYLVMYNNGTTQTITQSAPFDANIIPVGLPFLDSLLSQSANNVNELRITIGSKTFYVGFEKLCEANLSYMEILFLEPLGGRSTMVFQDVDDAGIQIQNTTANIYKKVDNITELRATGDSIIYKEAYGTYSFTRQLEDSDEGEIRWVQGFGAATEHHLLLKDIDGNRFWGKFEVSNITLNKDNKTISCAGRLSRAISAPYVL